MNHDCFQGDVTVYLESLPHAAAFRLWLSDGLLVGCDSHAVQVEIGVIGKVGVYADPDRLLGYFRLGVLPVTAIENLDARLAGNRTASDVMVTVRTQIANLLMNRHAWFSTDPAFLRLCLAGAIGAYVGGSLPGASTWQDDVKPAALLACADYLTTTAPERTDDIVALLRLSQIPDLIAFADRITMRNLARQSALAVPRESSSRLRGRPAL